MKNTGKPDLMGMGNEISLNGRRRVEDVFFFVTSLVMSTPA